METSYIKEFVLFSRHLNFSKTARLLNFSQSTLSHHLSALEDEFGVTLIDRTSPISLTPAGRYLVRRAADWLKDYDEIVDGVHRVAENSLYLTICVDDTRTAAHNSLYSALFRFSKLHPDITVQYLRCTDPTAAAALANPHLDCVGVIMCPIPSDLEAGVCYQRIPAQYPNKLFLWMDKSHPLAKRLELHWEDMNGIHLPLPNTFNPLWASTMPQVLKNHGVSFTTSLSALSPSSFLCAIGPDEVQLYDEGWKDLTAIAVDNNRFLKPINEPDAISESYIAYLPDRVSPALRMFLDYIDTLQDAIAN